MKVMIALGAVTQQASGQVDRHLANAKRDLEAILQQQAAITNDLWIRLEEELSLAQALWESLAGASEEGKDKQEEQQHAQALFRESVQAHDVGQVNEAIAHAKSVGLEEASSLSEDLDDLLKKLRSEEELETFWRCFVRAFDDKDALDLDVWTEEAQAQNLVVPENVHSAVQAVRGAEEAKRAEREYQASFEARVEDAFERGDRSELGRLSTEALALGGDGSRAKARLNELRGTLGGDAHNGPSPSHTKAHPGADSAGGAGATEGLCNMPVERLLQQSVADLRAELSKFGLDTAGLVEKEELVRVLLAARTAQEAEEEAAASASASAQAGPNSSSPSSSVPPPKTPYKQPSPGGGGGGGDAGAGTGPHPHIPPPPPRKEGPKLPKAELQGRWFRSSGAAILIAGEVVTFSNGETATLEATATGFSMVFAGRTHHGKLSKGSIVWSDGDVWGRTSRSGPQRPKGGGARPPPPASNNSGMNREKALQCLEISTPNPTDDDIRKAYKKAALRWHPDRRQNHSKADEAKEKFQEVRAAFEYLQG